MGLLHSYPAAVLREAFDGWQKAQAVCTLKKDL